MKIGWGRVLLVAAFSAAVSCKRSPEAAPVASVQPEDSVSDRAQRWRVTATHAGQEFRIGFRGGPNARAVDWTSVGSVLLRDAWTGEPLATLARDSAKPQFAVLSQDASRLLFGRADLVLELWDAIKGTRIATLGRIGQWGAPVVSADSLIAVAFVDGEGRVYDLSDGTLRHSLATERGQLVVAADGARAMIGKELWDLERGVRIATLEAWMIGDRSFWFSPDSHFVLATHEREVRLWRAADGVQVWKMPAPTNVEDPGGVAGAWWGPAAVFVSWSRTAGLYGLPDGDLRANAVPPEAVAFSADGRRVAVARPAKLEIFDVPTGRLEHSLVGPVRGVWYDRDGRLLVERADADRAAAMGATSVRLSKYGMREPARLSADGSHFFVGETNVRGRTGVEARIVAVPSGESVEPVPGPRFHHAAFLDEARVLAVGQTTELWAYDGDGLERVATCPDLFPGAAGLESPVTVPFDRGGRVLVAMGEDVIELRTAADSCDEVCRIDRTGKAFIAELQFGAALADLPTKAGYGRRGWVLLPDGTGHAAWGIDGVEPAFAAGPQSATPWPDPDNDPRVVSASWTTDGTQLALLDDEGDLWVWRSGAEALRHVTAAVPLGTGGPHVSLAGPYAFVSTGEAVHAIPFQEGSTREVRSIPLAVHMQRSQDGERIAVAIRDRGRSHVRVYATADLTELVDVATPLGSIGSLGSIDSVGFSPSGNRIIAAGNGMVVVEGPAG